MPDFDFDTVDRTLIRLEAGVRAAELDGSLAGFLCAGGLAPADDWFAPLAFDELDDLIVEPPDRALFGALFAARQTDLEGDEFGFEPLLPDDERPIAERAHALTEWCRGFLGGLGLGGVALETRLSAEITEIVTDLGRIAATEFDAGDSVDDDESAYAEMVEYVRVGVMLLHQELAHSIEPGTRH